MNLNGSVQFLSGTAVATGILDIPASSPQTAAKLILAAVISLVTQLSIKYLGKWIDKKFPSQDKP